jgi:hypothetical protein
MPAGELGIEQLQAALPGQRRTRPDGACQVPVGERSGWAGRPQLQHRVGEMLLGFVAVGRRVAHDVYGKAATELFQRNRPDRRSGGTWR